jgi:hypothetical protein
MLKLVQTTCATESGETLHKLTWTSTNCGNLDDYIAFCTNVHVYISRTSDPQLNLFYGDKSGYNAVGNYSLLQYFMQHHSTEPSTWIFINKVLKHGLVAGPDVISLSRGWDQHTQCGAAQGDDILKALLNQSVHLGIDDVLIEVFNNLLKPELYFLSEAYQANHNAVTALIDHINFFHGKGENHLMALAEKYIKSNLEGENKQIAFGIIPILSEYQASHELALSEYQTQLVISGVTIGEVLRESYQTTRDCDKPYFCGSKAHVDFVRLSHKLFPLSQEAAETMRYEFYGKLTGINGMPTLDSFFEGGLVTQLGALPASSARGDVMSSGQNYLKKFLKQYEINHEIKGGYWQEYGDNPTTFLSPYHHEVGVAGGSSDFLAEDLD